MSPKPLIAVLRDKLPQTRPPFWFMRQAGRYLPEYREIRSRATDFLALCYAPALAAEVTLQPVRRFAPDAAILFSDILVVPDALGQPLRYVEGEGPQLDPIRDRTELRRLTRTRFAARLAPVYETVARVRASLPADVALIGFAGAPWTVAAYMVQGGGDGNFFAPRTWMYADPEGFGQLMDLLVETTAEYLIEQVDAGAEALQLFDTWAGLLPADRLDRWCFAPTRAIVDRVRATHAAVPIIGFPRGIGANLKSYVEATAVDAVGLDTATDVGWADNELRRAVAVQGNLDPAAVVAGGEPMIDAARHIAQRLRERPHVFNLGHGLVPQTPPAHVEALARFLREDGGAGA